MERVRTLVLGAGMSGLGAAATLVERGDRDVRVLERDPEIGGYCKTVQRAGFTWDYSGHFFHFKHPHIEAWLRAGMNTQQLRTVQKRSFIDFEGRWIDFPFQKNIHQLPRAAFLECLHDLYFCESARARRGELPALAEPSSFYEMLHQRYGRAIAEAFLIPYNEKLYATDLRRLDADAMGRFFPQADLDAVIANMKAPDNVSYNSTFTYPRGGAIEYVRALSGRLPAGTVECGAAVHAIDGAAKIAYVGERAIRYERLISSAPLPALYRLMGLAHDAEAFSWNQVLVFNLGFDRKGPRDVHWVYYPSKELSFYRVGFYDNIFDSERMSLYVELGFGKGAAIDVDAARTKVLSDLRKVGLVQEHQLIAEHSVVMDPAYVHVSARARAEQARLEPALREAGVHSIGRYGGWTYCSIEDNLLEARALVDSWR